MNNYPVHFYTQHLKQSYTYTHITFNKLPTIPCNYLALFLVLCSIGNVAGNLYQQSAFTMFFLIHETLQYGQFLKIIYSFYLKETQQNTWHTTKQYKWKKMKSRRRRKKSYICFFFTKKWLTLNRSSPNRTLATLIALDSPQLFPMLFDARVHKDLECKPDALTQNLRLVWWYHKAVWSVSRLSDVETTAQILSGTVICCWSQLHPVLHDFFSSTHQLLLLICCTDFLVFIICCQKAKVGDTVVMSEWSQLDSRRPQNQTLIKQNGYTLTHSH